MGISPNLSSVSCELRIIRAKDLEFISSGTLFLRYYLQTENGKRICLNSQEKPSKSKLYWNESIALECVGSEDALDNLKQQSIMIELRWIKSSRVFGKLGRSRLLFRAEMGWKEALGSSGWSIRKWITTSTTSKYVLEGQKAPALEIEMKVQAPKSVPEYPKRYCRSECGCRHGGCNGRDDDIFALAEAQYLL